MHKEKMYRLGEYLITVTDNGQVLWQTHAPFATERRGNCYILGNILILGQCRDEDQGYLKMEFHDHLRKLPQWTKTDFYCSSVSLLDIITGQVVTEEFIQQLTMLVQIRGASEDSSTITGRGAFRLWQYRINVAGDDRVSWQTIEGLDKIIGGQCLIESNVLFMCPQDYVQEHQNKHEFLKKIDRLTQWKNTIVWCRSMALEECRPRQAPGRYRAIAGIENLRQRVFPGETSSKDHRGQGRSEAFKIPLLSAHKLLSALGPRLWSGIRRTGALFKRLTLAFLGASVFLVGLALIFYTAVKGCHHRGDDHHHKHEHHHD